MKQYLKHFTSAVCSTALLALSFFMTSYNLEAGCNKRIKWECGKVYNHNTKTNGESAWNNYSTCNNQYTGFNGYEAVYYYKPNTKMDILLEFYDQDKKGLDYFIYRYACNGGADNCITAKLRSGSDNQYWSYTIKNAEPNVEYYVFIDTKNSGTHGDYQFKATCGVNNEYDYCDNYMNAHCGTKYTGNTNSGSDKYHDYKCFHNSFDDFHAKEVVYKFRSRPNTTHDIELDFYDRDGVGLDIFIMENCGKNDYKCYAYYERQSNDPKEFTWTIKNCNPNKDYYMIIDAKNSTGRYEFTPYCYKQDYVCDKYEELKCGFERSGHTKDGYDNYDDYSCFKSHLTGFHAKERVYKLTGYPSSNYDLEITFEDIHDRGLDLFLVENCGKQDYKCYRYYERTSSNPKKETFTWYNLDYKKDYYIIIDAKSVTGGYKIYAKCKPKGYLCDKYKDIECGERKYGHTKNGYADYDDYSCFDGHLTGFYAKELVYKIKNRPNYVHDIYIDFEDIFDKGLDIYVVENCGKQDYRCYAYKERTGSDPKKDKLTIYDTDPNKEYYIIIDAKNVTSDFYLTVRCEDRTRCYDPCFNYVKRSDGTYDCYWPDAQYNQRDYYEWHFKHEDSGNTVTRSGGNLFGYKFPFGKGLYKVSIRDNKENVLCYYYIYYDDCDNDYPMAKRYDYTQRNCSGNSCTYDLDASSSMGNGLYYHWYFVYGNKNRNKQYSSQNAQMSVNVDHVDDLLSICLVVTNPCGMSAFCIQGDCFNSYPAYNITATSDRDIEISFDSWSVGCNNGGRKVYVDWGNGKSSTYDYSNSLKPKYKYDQPGNYLVCVRFYYECTGNDYRRGCTICICKTISLGCKEDIRNEECDYISYQQGNYVDGKWEYFVSHSGGPNGYQWNEYSYIDIESGETFTSQNGEYKLTPGRDYFLCVIYRNNEGCYYYCCKRITVYYPSNVNYHLPSKGSGGNGTMTGIPVTVNGFNEVTGFQFKIKVGDANIAQIVDEITELNQELGLSAGDVTVSEQQNLINVAWTTDLNNQAQSVADGSTLFVFKVMFTGITGDSTTMQFEDVLAFNNLTNQQIDVTFDDGILCVSSSVSISGALTREDGSPLANTTVNLSGEMSASQKTDENGNYSFNGLVPGDYSVSPSKSQNFHDGVNIIDVAMIRSYNRSLDEDRNFTAYQLLASNTRKVLDGGLLTVADETALKRMNTLDIDEWPDYSNSWVFVPQSYEFSDPKKANLDNHPTALSYENLTESMSGQNFIAIKMGDINGDLNLAGPRSVKDVSMQFENTSAPSGDSVFVNLNGAGFENIQNMQFTITWDPTIMEFRGWQSTMEILGLEASSFSTRFVDEGKLTFAHSIAPGAVTFTDSTLFALKFRMIGLDGQTSSLNITGDPLPILVTDNQFQPQNVNTESATVTIGMSTSVGDLINRQDALRPNRPNPFKDFTIIPFVLEESGPITLDIFNHTGVRVFSHNGNYSPGNHQVKVMSSDLGASGLYYYQIVTKNGRSTRPMILIE